jgi:hypothetical protein
MKKVLAVLLLTLATVPALAQHHGHGFRHHGHHGHYRGPSVGWWLAPVVVGAIGYELGRQQVIVQSPPVVVQQPPLVYQLNQNCTPWTETQNLDGTITRTRTCNQ